MELMELNLQVMPVEIKEFNFEELKKSLQEKLTYYNNLAVTEDSIKSAKEDRSNLNKLIKVIEQKRIDTKKECLKPYEDIEVKCKELVSLIDEPVKAIDTQIKAFDEAENNKKYAEIVEFYTANIKELAGLVLIDHIINPKWKNATVSVTSVCDELKSKIDKIRNDLKVITAFKSEFELNIKDKYLQTYDMSAALSEKNRLEEQKAKLEAAEKERQAEEKAKCAVSGYNTTICGASVTPVISHETQQTTINEPVSVPDDRKTIKVIFYDTTADFRTEMRALTDKHNIKYGGIQ